MRQRNARSCMDRAMKFEFRAALRARGSIVMGSVVIVPLPGRIDAASDERARDEARQDKRGGDREEGEDFDGHGVHLFSCLPD